MSIIDLDKQFVFYASYHHDKVNKAIHILCVWPILWSAFVLLEYTPTFLSLAPLSAIHPINGAFILAVFYAVAYLLMEQKGAGATAATLVFLALLGANRFFHNAPTSCGYPAWQLALACNVGCWIMQFIGHGKFEGRAPALLDNLVQAFLMAPLFVLLEVMFNFGYQKEFQKKIWKKVEAEIARVKASQKSKKSK